MITILYKGTQNKIARNLEHEAGTIFHCTRNNRKKQHKTNELF